MTKLLKYELAKSYSGCKLFSVFAAAAFNDAAHLIDVREQVLSITDLAENR
jgi:hypothetical protein